MTTRELTVPDSVRHLQEDDIVTVLSRHNLNVTEAARDLDVPSADLRELLRANPQYRAAAVERMEHFVDLAEANIYEGLKSDDPRVRFSAGCFVVRYSGRAGERGWVTFGTSNFEPAPVEPKKFVVRWGNPDGTLEERATETIERDGRLIEVPVYPKATCDLQPLKQLPPAQRDKILARIEEGSDDPDEIIDHLKRKGFDTSELE